MYNIYSWKPEEEPELVFEDPSEEKLTFTKQTLLIRWEWM